MLPARNRTGFRRLPGGGEQGLELQVGWNPRVGLRWDRRAATSSAASVHYAVEAQVALEPCRPEMPWTWWRA